MSFYAGSAGSVVVPTTNSSYGIPVAHSVHAQPVVAAQPMYHHPPPLTIAPMQYQQPVHYAYAQPRAISAVPLTANPLMYQSYGYGAYPGGYYPRGPPTVVISSSRRHKRRSSRGFLGYL